MAGLNFGDTAFEGQLPADTPILDPVTDDSGLFLAEANANAAKSMAKGFDAIASGIDDASAFFAVGQQKRAQAASDSVLAGFQSEVMLIADAVEQGLSVPAARMRLRALNAQYVANNPALLKEINELQSTLTKTHGLASITTTGNEEIELRKKIEDEAVSAGWQGAGMTPSQAADNMLAAKRSAEEFAKFKRDIETKQLYRQEITEADKFKATQTLKGFMESTFPWIESQVSQAYDNLAKGADPAILIDQLKLNINNEMAKVGFLKSMGGDMDISYMLKGVEDSVKLFESYAKGEVTTEVYEAQIKQIKAKHELVLRTDVILGPLLSASELVGNADYNLLTQISARSTELFGKNFKYGMDDNGNPTFTDKPADVVGDDNDIRGYLVPLRSMIKNSLTDADPEMKREISTQITNLLRGIKSHSSSAESAVDFRDIVEFFADPSIGKFAETNSGIIPANVKGQAGYVIQEQYEKVVLPLVQKEYEDAITEVFPESDADPLGTFMEGEQVDVANAIEPFWNGSAVEFRAAPGLESNAAIARVVQRLNEGPSSIAQPLNTLIRAKAHIAGTTNYQQVYEKDLAPRLWGTEEEGEGSEEVKLPEGIEIGDFNPDMEEEYVKGLNAMIDEGPTSEDGSPNYLMNLRSAESSGNDNAQNRKSSANGRYQFLKGTWDDLVRRYPGSGLTNDGRGNADQEEVAIRLFTRENAKQLQAAGIPITDANLYAAHFLGAVDAVDVLAAPGTALVSEYVPPRVISANPFLKGMTVAEFKAWSTKKFKKKVK